MFGEAFDGRDDLDRQLHARTIAPERRPSSSASSNACPTASRSPATSSTARSTSRSTSRRSATFPGRPVDRPHPGAVGGTADALRAPRRRARHRPGAHRHPGQLPRQPRRAALPVQRQRQPPGRAAPLLHNALLFIFTAQGIPCIYYGTEQEFSRGQRPGQPRATVGQRLRHERPDVQWIKQLIADPPGLPSLRRGEVTWRWSTAHTGDEPDAGIFAFERYGGDAGGCYALVVLNSNQDHASHTGFEAPRWRCRPAGDACWSTCSGRRRTRRRRSRATAPSTSPCRRWAAVLLVPEPSSCSTPSEVGARWSSVSLRRVSKRFGRPGCSTEIDAEIPDGAFAVLVGPSGCGKSTLLRLHRGARGGHHGGDPLRRPRRDRARAARPGHRDGVPVATRCTRT